MIRLFSTVLFFIQTSAVFAQDYKYTYYLDQNLISTQKDQAIFLGRGMEDGGLLKMDCFNNATNKLIFSAHFNDSTLAVFEGLFQSFYEDGKKESEGNYHDGLEINVWRKWNTAGQMTDSSFYEKGEKKILSHYEYNVNGTISMYLFHDSIADNHLMIEYSEEGKKQSEMRFSSTSSVVKKYDGSGNFVIVPSSSEKETEGSFLGGPHGFKKFLEKNLRSGLPVENGAKPGVYTVIVRFMIYPDGKITNIIPETNLGYGMEEEVVRVIKRSDLSWLPARMFGVPVKSYRRQPVTFVVAEN